MRAKWSAPIRKYWKISEQMMVKYCDLAICDSVNSHAFGFECVWGGHGHIAASLIRHLLYSDRKRIIEFIFN